jgi:DNA polymerase III gamma/tau subunit
MSSSGGAIATGQLPPTAVIGAGANVPLATKAGTKIVNVPPFQAATAYPEGFCVLHEGGVYKRITAGTSGASWAADESHWELQLPASVVTTSGAQTIAGVKTFTSSPVVPVPTTAEQAARKATVEAETARAEAAEATKAPLASPALTGTPTAPTPTANANTTQIATAAAVHTAKGEAQSEAETLAAAAQSGAEGAATTALALKAPLASPALTGTPTAPTPTESDSSTKLATTAFAHEVATTAKSAAETASIPLTQKGAIRRRPARLGIPPTHGRASTFGGKRTNYRYGQRRTDRTRLGTSCANRWC